MGSPSSPRSNAVDYSNLKERMGEALLSQRLLSQADLWADKAHQDEGIFKLNRILPIDQTLTLLLKLTGTYSRGHRNFFAIELNHNPVEIQHLPSALEGYRILHLSDLHLDLCPDLTPVILERIAPAEYDLAVITGDYRNSSTDDHHVAIRETTRVIKALKTPSLGILGNHDFIEMVPGLEKAGLQFLLNETTTLRHNDTPLLVAGIDDPHFYQTENFEAFEGALKQAPFKLLLSHSPETYRRAAAYGFDFMLSGHTHGGQICLPNGKAIVKIGNCPDEMLAGPWSYGTLNGYTSRGTGSCGVPIRFFCPPEITIHELRSSKP